MSSILAKIETKKTFWCSKQCAVHGAAKDTNILRSHRIMAAATAADGDLKIALPPQRLEGAVTFLNFFFI